MKSGYLKKFAAGVLVAAMAVTAVPAVSQIVNPTVTAEARTSKAKLHFNEDGVYNALGVGKQIGYYFLIENEKPKAKYTFTTNSKNLKVSRKKDGDYIVAKKTGTYKVTCKEKYKGRTTKIGTVKVKVHKQGANNATVYIEDERFYVENFIKYPYSPWYIQVTEGADLVKYVTEGQNAWYDLKTDKEGTVKFKVMDGYKKKVGTATITLKHNNCTDVINPGDSSFTTYVGDSEQEIREGYNYVRLSDAYTKSDFDNEEESSTPIAQDVSITSDNSSVVSVRYGKPSHSSDDEDEDYDDEDEDDAWYLKGVSAGTANITISCNGHSVSIPVTVYANEDEYDKAKGYDEDDEDDEDDY